MILCAVLSLAAIAVLTWFIQVEGRSFPLLVYAGPVYVWIVFYALGLWIAKNRNRNCLALGRTLVVAGYVLQLVEVWHWFPMHGGGLGIKTSSFIFSAGVILVALSPWAESKFNTNRLTRSVAWLGEVSFGVYLTHCYVIVALGTVVHTGLWAVSWALTLAVTLCGLWVLRKTLPRDFTYRYLGF